MASLISCFSAAYAATDIDAAISQCEERQFGTEWRQAALARSDAGARNGWLAPELIQASTRSRFFLFRKCYETGLSRNGGLGGRVAVKFVIDSFGRVEKAEDFGSELADAEVVACIVKEFSGLRFPKPERGTVTVVYPIHFNPGD